MYGNGTTCRPSLVQELPIDPHQIRKEIKDIQRKKEKTEYGGIDHMT